MARILYVSKPIAPPWNDGSKNLVREVARHLPPRHQALLMGRRNLPGAEAVAPARLLPVHPPHRGRFGSSSAERLRTFGALASHPDVHAWHLFFAPSPATARAMALARRLRRRPSLHTVCSAPRPEADPSRLLLADLTVVLSEHTERRYLRAGVPAERLRRIPVPLTPPATPSPEAVARMRRALSLPSEALLVVYAGDLEIGGGAERTLRAFERLPAPIRREAVLVLACRPKSPRAEAIATSLRARFETREALRGRIRWAGELPFVHALLAAADVVALPSDSLFAKVDHPLVLLEAMSLGTPVLVCEGTAAAELAPGGALVVQANPEAVAEGLGRLLEDRPDAAARGRLGAEYVRTTHAPNRVAEAYASLYDELIGT